MTDKQIKWASSHDWYVGHGVNAENQVFIRVDLGEGRTLDFTNFDRLTKWAGI